LFTSIMVPLDGTRFAEEALPWALRAAIRSGGTLHPVMVHLADRLHETGLPLTMSQASEGSRLHERERTYLERVVADLSALDVDVAAPEVIHGDVGRALAEHVSSRRIDAVVMASHDRGEVERLVMPGVADALVHRVRVPVLLIRPDADAEPRPVDQPASPIRTVVAGVDGSDAGEAPLDPALALAEPGAELVLVDVVSPPPLLSSSYIPHAVVIQREQREEREARAAAYLEGLVARFRDRGVPVRGLAPLHRNAARAIVEAAEEVGAGLVALGAKGHGRLREALFGSVTHDVLHGTPQPVLVAREAP
jgi:nucleotide-binding universal stress UspA family protein